MTTIPHPLAPCSRRPSAPRHAWILLAAGGALLLTTLALGQPTITTEPVDQSVSLNATVQFKVTARASAGSLSFAWWFKDAALDPALNPPPPEVCSCSAM